MEPRRGALRTALVGLFLFVVGAAMLAGDVRDAPLRDLDPVSALMYLAMAVGGGVLVRRAVRRLRRRLRFTVTGNQVRVDWRIGDRSERTEIFDQGELDRIAIDLEVGEPAGVSREGNFTRIRLRQEQRRRLVLQTRSVALPLTEERQDTGEAPYETAAKQIEEFLAIGQRRER